MEADTVIIQRLPPLTTYHKEVGATSGFSWSELDELSEDAKFQTDALMSQDAPARRPSSGRTASRLPQAVKKGHKLRGSAAKATAARRAAGVRGTKRNTKASTNKTRIVKENKIRQELQARRGEKKTEIEKKKVKTEKRRGLPRRGGSSRARTSSDSEDVAQKQNEIANAGVTEAYYANQVRMIVKEKNAGRSELRRRGSGRDKKATGSGPDPNAAAEAVQEFQKLPSNSSQWRDIAGVFGSEWQEPGGGDQATSGPRGPQASTSRGSNSAAEKKDN
ncbi:unnamed protein product [Amoebophrya sp. A120]|nr:unnamed protein product [Amoebophrya sp. A120]|eukprot:GSA120T00006231001.1